MKPLVIVQSSPLKQTAVELASAARKRGYEVQDISFHRDEPQPPSLAGHFPVFVFGSVALIQGWSKSYEELSPWIWYDHDRLGPVMWSQNLGAAFLNASGRTMSVADFVLGPQCAIGKWHVRPLLNDKRPPGRLYDQTEIIDLDLPPDLLLWVSEPAKIVDEVRVWFVGSKAVVASQYRDQGVPVRISNSNAIDAALEAAQVHAAAFLPHPHCVMDLGLTIDKKWKVIEFNPIHGAGWYAADPGIVLDAFVAHFQNASSEGERG